MRDARKVHQKVRKKCIKTASKVREKCVKCAKCVNWIKCAKCANWVYSAQSAYKVRKKVRKECAPSQSARTKCVESA